MFCENVIIKQNKTNQQKAMHINEIKMKNNKTKVKWKKKKDKEIPNNVGRLLCWKLASRIWSGFPTVLTSVIYKYNMPLAWEIRKKRR